MGLEGHVPRDMDLLWGLGHSVTSSNFMTLGKSISLTEPRFLLN